MAATETSVERPAIAAQCLLRSAALATFASCAFVMQTPTDAPRLRAAPTLHADADLDVSHNVSIDFVAAPMVTTPQACVAHFGLDVLPVVAAVVDVVLMDRVILSQIGGLYGP